jgi:hypothetical protein
MKFGIRLMEKVPSITVAAERITLEALTKDLAEAIKLHTLPNGTTFAHSSIIITSEELPVFLGDKRENTRLLTNLTDLWDVDRPSWKYRTKGKGTDEITGPWLGMLAASTPEGLMDSLPYSTIGAGFTSRIIFVYADNKSHSVSLPVETPELIDLRRQLIHDLEAISIMGGEMNFSQDGYDFWDQWYQSYDEKPVAMDTRFSAYAQRKPTMMLKMAICLSAAEGDSMLIEPSHLKGALGLLDGIEADMPRSFGGLGRAKEGPIVDRVMRQLRACTEIKEGDLMSLNWRDTDLDGLNRVLAMLQKMGVAKSRWEQRTNEPAVIYWKWVGD